MKSEIVEWNGKVWRRYPKSKRGNDRNYFKCKYEYLHRAVWSYYNGDIPKDYHIHHKDGNPLNNDISNLEAVDPVEHLSYHALKNNISEDFIKKIMAHRKSFVKKAPEWHRSKEGMDWHREHAKNSILKRFESTTTKRCDQCLSDFQTAIESAKFCSNKCKSKWRRDNGLDNVVKECVICGNVFTSNRYDKINTCSRSCGFKSRNQ